MLFRGTVGPANRIWILLSFMWTVTLLAPPVDAEVLASGAFLLGVDSSNATAWLVVPANHSLRWSTGSEAYMDFWAEVAELGPVSSLDGYGTTGCAWTPDPIHFRLRWANPDRIYQASTIAHVNYTIEVLGEVGDCEPARILAQRDRENHPDAWSPSLTLFVLITALLATSAMVVGAFRWWVHDRRFKLGNGRAQRGRRRR